MKKDKTLAERSRRLRARRKAEGLVLLREWVTPEDRDYFRRIIHQNLELGEMVSAAIEATLKDRP